MALYKTYLFQDKDPIIDQLRTIMQKEDIDIKSAALASGITEHTLWAWFFGMTRQPRHSTVKALIVALGYNYELTKQTTLRVVSRRNNI